MPEGQGTEVPVLTRELTCDPHSLILGQAWLLTRTITYSAPPSARAIVFHVDPIYGGYPSTTDTLYSLKENRDWVKVETRNNGVLGCPGECHDNSNHNPYPVFVGTTPRDFTCLRPGETWTFTIREYDQDDIFPENMHGGDRFQWRYAGAEIDWWDWGTMEDHKDTKVLYVSRDVRSGNVGRVTSGNEGRPLLRVSEATLDFVVGFDET